MFKTEFLNVPLWRHEHGMFVKGVHVAEFGLDPELDFVTVLVVIGVVVVVVVVVEVVR